MVKEIKKSYPFSFSFSPCLLHPKSPLHQDLAFKILATFMLNLNKEHVCVIHYAGSLSINNFYRT